MTHESSTRGRGGASNMQPTSASDIASPGSVAILRITPSLCHEFSGNARAGPVSTAAMRTLLPLAFLIFGCSTAEVVNEVTAAASGAAPVIVSKSLSVTSIARPATGALLVDLRLGFSDADGDATGLEIVRTSPEGTQRRITVAGAWTYGVTGASGDATYPLAIHPGDAAGAYRYDVVVTDRAHHRSAPATLSLTVAQGAVAPLAVTGIDPTRAAPGTQLQITGRGFDPKPDGNTVTVGAARARVTSATATRLVVTVPPGATSGPVGVSNRLGTTIGATAIAIDRSIQITGNLRAIEAGATTQFTARLVGIRGSPIAWTVNGIAGGNATVGRIDATGAYTAPVTVPPSGQVTIGAAVGTGSQASSTSIAINVTGPCGEPEVVVVPSGGATVFDPSGLIRLVLTGGAVATGTTITLTATGGAAVPSGYRALRRFTATSDRSVDFASPARVSIALPSWRTPGKQLRVYRSGTATPSTATVDTSGLRADGLVSRIGDYVLVDAVVDAPPWNSTKMTAVALRVPPDLDLDPGTPNVVKEGATLPVLVTGANFGGGQLEVVAASGTVIGASASRAATPSELAALTIAGVQLSASQTQLGFTFRSAAIPTLHAGERMQIAFALHRFAGGPKPAEVLITPQAWFAVLGLPELLVSRKPPAQRDLFAADGTPIDALISETGCQAVAGCAIGSPGCTFPATGCYSAIKVEFGATLGIGVPLTSAFLPGPDGAPVPTDLSDLTKVQARYGQLPWAAGAPPGAKLFVPFREHVEIDVAGAVDIGGQIYLAGMRGGENQELRVDPSQPDQSEQARRAGLGGLVASLAGDVFVSGGMGGDGGVTTGSGESVFAGDGNPAGNGILDTGKGRLADGSLLNLDPPALGGKGVRHADRPLLGFLNAVAEQAGSVATLLTTTALPATEKFLHLLGGAAGTDFGPLATQLDFVQTGSKAFGELSGLNGVVAGVGKSLFTPEATSYAGPSPDYYGGRGGHGGARRSPTDPRLELDADIEPGSGAGGGGGGGASTEVTTIPHVIPLASQFAFHDNRVGGGGGGGGGAAGSVRITAGDKIIVGTSAVVAAYGGGGGYGQRHVLMAGAGGGGGGGTGGNLKLQAPVVINAHRIDASGGDSGGAILGMGGAPIPSCGLAPQILGGQFNGGFVAYYPGESRLSMIYPTGRVRARIATGAPVAGVGVALDAAGAADGSLWIVEPSPSGRLWHTQPMDYNDGIVPPRSPTEWAQDLGTAATTAVPGLTVVDVAQSPLPPYHLFVAGFVPVGPDMFAKLVELDTQGAFVREAFSIQVYDQTSGGNGPYYIASADFDSAGQAYLMMAARIGNLIESGVFRLDLASGSLTRVISNVANFDGMSILHAASFDGTEDQIATTMCAQELAVDNSRPEYDARMLRYSLDGDPVAQVTMGIESMGGPGQAGLVRIDGLDECSQLPIVNENGDSVIPYDDFTYFGPTVGSLGTAQVLDLEQRVTRSSTLALQIGGAGPEHRDTAASPQHFEVRVVHESAAIAVYPNLLANFRGTLLLPVTVQAGFSSVYVQAFVGGESPTLLQRQVLYLP